MSPRSSRTATWTGRVGVLLVVAGLVLAGYVAWQLFGTNVASQRTHASLVEEAEQAWQVADDDRAGQIDERDAVPTDHGDLSAIVRIPALGDDYAVPVLEGSSDEVLAAGFGHLEDTAGPGERGNYVLAAHRVTHGEPLRDMPSLDSGDEVIIETGRWVYTYVLDTPGDGLTVPFTGAWVLADLPRNPEPGGVQPPDREPGQRLITLTTCSELFHTDDRLVAFGHLDSKEPRSAS
ncbi:class E sortase [Nocardioides sp. Soil777]|uniref:class E sortase n=1 Tax=Nocardioides sp. Soil777 TaxID=1736409 RepID=UPI000A7088E5|nr:class E sortase [Nocardioides sp. Soil777]